MSVTQKHTADVTVAISTRDRSDVLARCLAALLAGQVLPTEIVVVDQSRDDRTRLVVELQESPIPLIYVHHKGRGLGISQNIAIRHARCPIVAVTDDDCIPTPEWIARIAQEFFAAPQPIDALMGRVLPQGPEMPGLYAVSSRTSEVRAEFNSSTMPWDMGSGNNFAVKREWLNRICGNDERLGPGATGQGGVDMDLFYRLLRAGARICYEPGILVYHERTNKAGRIARRAPYGYGMGAACIIWMRQGDHNAPRVLGYWLKLRAWRLLGALRRREWDSAYEELLVLRGTFGGLVHGCSVRGEARGVAGE